MRSEEKRQRGRDNGEEGTKKRMGDGSMVRVEEEYSLKEMCRRANVRKESSGRNKVRWCITRQNK